MLAFLSLMLTGFPLGLFLLLVSNHLLDRPDIGRTLLPETLEIENFNELRERSLPRHGILILGALGDDIDGLM